MNSMTGFGRALFSLGGAGYRVEMRSVNNRFLDVKLRLPWTDAEIESRCVATVRQRLARGRVDVAVFGHATQGSAKPLQLNETVATQLRLALERLETVLSCDRATAATLLPRLPDLLSDKSIGDTDAVWPAFEEAVGRACDALIAMRLREGEALKADLQAQLAQISACVDHVAQRVADQPQRLQKRLTERLTALTGGEQGGIENTRLFQEVALFADRCDVNEEIARLRSHVAQLSELFERDEPIGRTMEFLLQEVNRELNTIGSKTDMAEVSMLIVEAKGCLEKMREQAQNVE